MPVNGGRDLSKRWYRQCFVPINAESSDDSDTESVIIPHTSTTTDATWEQEFIPPPPTPMPRPPPLSPPPPPLPPPPPPPPSPPHPTNISWEDLFPPSPMTLSPPTSPRLFSPEPSPPSHLLSSLPPPPTSTTTWEGYFPSSPLPPPPPPLLSWVPPLRSISMQIRSAELSSNESSEHDTHEHPLISKMKISELHEKDKVPNCPICLEEFKDDDEASKLPCNHTFCYKCILRWINNNKTCPVCRLQLDDCKGDDSFDQQPHPIPVPVSENHVWSFFFRSSSDVSENSEGGNSDEGDFESACEELGDSNANGDIVGTSQTGHV